MSLFDVTIFVFIISKHLMELIGTFIPPFYPRRRSRNFKTYL